MSSNPNDSGDLQAAKEFDQLAMQCWIQKKIPDAVSYYRKALEIRERILGPYHWEVANSLVGLAGFVGRGERDSPERVALWERALAIFERLYREPGAAKSGSFRYVFQGLLGTLGNLAGHAFHQGKLDEAERGFRQIQIMIEEEYGPDCRWVHPTLPTFAKVLIRQGKVDEAEKRLRAAIEQTPKKDSIDEWTQSESLTILADLYVKHGRAAEAEVLYRQAVALMESASRPIAWLLASALEGLADVCRKSNRPAEADQLENKAQEVRDSAATVNRPPK